MQLAKRVAKAGAQHGRKGVALLLREARVALVGLWIGNVDLGVGHIQVAANYQRFLFPEAGEVLQKGRIPFLAVLQPL